MVFRDTKGFSIRLYKEAILHRCSLVSNNMFYERNTYCVRLPDTYARYRNYITRHHCIKFVLYYVTS